MTAALHISSTLALPVDFVTKTAAIIAQRRKGKTYTAAVLAEEMVSVKQPFVALDPTGAWWGLRASADGKSAGLPVVILGGQHGDVPLERTTGRFVAELVVDEPGYYVIDFSLFESAEAERQFAADFAERLYRRKGQPNSDFALHLFVDEADRFAPQRPAPGDQRMLGAFEAIVRRGGLRGLGSTLITQRAAVLNKNVLEQIDILIALRTVGPNDRAAIERYVAAEGSDEVRTDLMSSLASLALGEAWVWEPGADPPLFDRVRIRERRTFNSSATPKPGERRAEPRQLAAVDLEAIKERMADTIAKADADDPVKLRRRIAVLEKQLRDHPAAEPVVTTMVETVEVPVFDESLVVRLEQALQPAIALIADIQERLTWETKTTDNAVEYRRALARQARHQTAPPKPVAPRGPARAAGDIAGITGGAKRMVMVLARHYPGTLTRAQLATMAKLKKTGGTFGTYWSRVTTAGLVEERGDQVSATPAGLAFAGIDDPDPLTADEIQGMWRERFTGGALRMLDLLIDAYPDPIDKASLAAGANVAPAGGTFGTYLSRLRTNGLVDVDVDQVTASSTLFIESTKVLV